MEWLQIDFDIDMVITAVETQGRFDGGRGLEYAPGYMLEYWRESLGTWARYKDGKQNEVSIVFKFFSLIKLIILKFGI